MGDFDEGLIRPPLVRVRLADTNHVHTITCDGRFVVRSFKDRDKPTTYSTTGSIKVIFSGDKAQLFDEHNVLLESGIYGVWVHPGRPGHLLKLNGSPFYGALVLGRDSDRSPLVVNRLNLDTYLTGVLAPELGRRSENEFEAVKAQAVAARTYALAHLGQYTNASYDLRADVGDQVYVGAAQQRDWVDRAVRDTRGEVLTYSGHLIEAYYHSTCGGKTDAIEDVWGKSPSPYLKSVDDDTACGWSKYSEWMEEFDEPTLLANLKAYRRQLRTPPIPDFQTVSDIILENETPGGRIRTMTIVTPAGRWVVAADKIRWALGRPTRPGTILPSARFSLDLRRADDGHIVGLVAKGNGYGHGVGMCQCGMIGRARAGEAYHDILTHYYTGVSIDCVYDGVHP